MNKSSSTTIKCKAPEEVWSNTLADYSRLRIFSCPAYVHVNEGKLERKAKKCIFLSYRSGVKGYRLWCLDPKSSKLIISRDVTFDDFVMLNLRKENVDVDMDHGVSKQVEFESYTSGKSQERTFI